MSIIACSVEGCERKFKGRGFCATHLSRFKIHGDPLKGAQVPRNTDPCRADGCEVGGNRTKGFCRKHYERMKSNGSWRDEDQLFTPGDFDACLYCDAPIPSEGILRRYCSGSCATSISRGFVIPPPFPCARCNVEVDLKVRLPTGRLRPRNTKMCTSCKPPSHMRKHFPALIARDGTECQLCGDHINAELKFPNPLSTSVDHIIPRSHGGLDEMNNYRLAHLGCNSRRGNRLDYVAA